MTNLTIESHTQTPDGPYTLVVRITDTAPGILAGIAGEAAWAPVDQPAAGEEPIQPTDTLHTTVWGADVAPEAQRTGTRLLIEQALAAAVVPVPAPTPVTEPGAEL